MSAIVIKDASRVFYSKAHPEGLVAFQDVTFDVPYGQFVSFLGPSGCGKSTLLNILAGLDKEATGQIEIAGESVLSTTGQRSSSISFVFQDPRLLPWLSVEKNIHFALGSAGVPREEWAERSSMWLERVHLERFHKAYPHELSGGMRQRVALARAFAVDADVLLMDEPFSGLDEFTARDMREQLLELWIQTGKTIVFVTHNSFEASFLSDRILAFSPRPGRVSYDMPIDIPRPRNYESAELFELSNQVARSLSKPL